MAHSRWYIAGLVTQSLFYAAGGINHFLHSRTYVAIMPPHYSHPLGMGAVHRRSRNRGSRGAAGAANPPRCRMGH